jgi:hypothetical protein
MAYQFDTPYLGLMPIANTDAGVTQPGSSSATPTPPMKVGMIVKASDPTLGEAEFILLAGVASTVVGSVVTYNSTTGLTTLAPAGNNKPQPIAIAMAANTATTTWGWYQISGQAVAAKTAALALASNAAVGVLTAGKIAATASGKEVQGAITMAKSTAGTTVTLLINRPHMQGRVS